MPHPVTAYGRSKLAAEQAVSSSSLRWSILRPPVVYGPRDREVLKVFRWPGSGLRRCSGMEPGALRSPCRRPGWRTGGCRQYAFDHRTHLLPLPSGSVYQRAIRDCGRCCYGPEGGNGSNSTPDRTCAALVTESSSRLLGQATILTRDKANEFFQAAWTGNPEPLTRDTGWRAAHDLRTGLTDTYLWYRKAGWL